MRINSKFLFSALLCVFACNTQSADAQFLKKLGKGLGKFLDAAAAISTSDDDNILLTLQAEARQPPTTVSKPL